MPDIYGNNAVVGFEPLQNQNFGYGGQPAIPDFGFNSSMAVPSQYQYQDPNQMGLSIGDYSLGNTPSVSGAEGIKKRSFLDKAFGSFNPETRAVDPGFFQPLASGIGAVGGVALGFKQLNQAEEAFDFQKDLAVGNFDLNQNTLAYNIGQRAASAAKLANATDSEAEAARKKAVTQSGVNDVQLSR